MEEEIRKEFMEMIKLLEEGKLQEFKQKATECPPVDIAEGLEEIEDEGRVLRVFRMLPKDISSDVFSYMTSEQQRPHRRKRDQRRTEGAGGRYVHG